MATLSPSLPSLNASPRQPICLPTIAIQAFLPSGLSELRFRVSSFPGQKVLRQTQHCSTPRRFAMSMAPTPAMVITFAASISLSFGRGPG